MVFPLTVALLGSHLVLAAADQIPQFDIDVGCRTAYAADVEVFGQGGGQGCKKDEQNALKQLNKEWAQFSASDRRLCQQLASEMDEPSYMELLTCLEMQAQVREYHHN
jgi:hypothetical protein